MIPYNYLIRHNFVRSLSHRVVYVVDFFGPSSTIQHFQLFDSLFDHDSFHVFINHGCSLLEIKNYLRYFVMATRFYNICQFHTQNKLRGGRHILHLTCYPIKLKLGHQYFMQIKSYAYTLLILLAYWCKTPFVPLWWRMLLPISTILHIPCLYYYNKTLTIFTNFVQSTDDVSNEVTTQIWSC